MIDNREALYEWGQPVRAVIDLFNDGSYPDAEEGALLAAAGTLGEIVQIGHHAEANIPIYLVEFEGRRVLGCLEEEIELASDSALAPAVPTLQEGA
jgi:nitrogen fixation protein NifZ